MNKAFVREPDDNGQARCPKCESLGVPVGPATLAAHLPPPLLRELSETAFFCPYPKCTVAYFDAFERTAPVDVLARPLFPKDPTAPLCSCFGLSPDDVEQDVREGGATRVRALLEKSKSPEARCLTAAADGRCCMPEVQRYFMRLRAAAAPG